MALNVNYDKKLGKIETNNPNVTYTIYASNAYCTFIQDQENEYPWNIGFWTDVTHLRRCLGLTKKYIGNLYDASWKSIRLNIADKHMATVARLFAKHCPNIKVEIYFEEI